MGRVVRDYWQFMILLLCLVIAYSWVATRWYAIEQPRSVDEMQVALPAPLQLLFTWGDRYLAANISVFRAVVVGVHQLKPQTYETLALVQQAAAQLNPYHEDNYYIAAAILPWNGQLPLTQDILSRAMAVRVSDALPAFFHGFNRYYFLHDYRGAAEDLLLAAERDQIGNARSLRSIAARWLERGYDIEQALLIVEGMLKNNRDKHLQPILAARVQRLRNLFQLQQAITVFQRRYARRPQQLQQLVSTKILPSLPLDPWGKKYTINSNGQARVVEDKP